MRRVGMIRGAAAAIVSALFAIGCVEQGPAAPTPPTPPSPLTGAYTLTLEPSAVCHLPVPRFAWDVEATSSGTASETQTMLVRATLPGGDASVDLNLAAALDSVTTGTLTARSAMFGEETLRLGLGGGVRATISAGPAGRSQVVDGTYNGEIALAPPEDPDPGSAGSCTAANHRWTLVPR